MTGIDGEYIIGADFKFTWMKLSVTSDVQTHTDNSIPRLTDKGPMLAS